MEGKDGLPVELFATAADWEAWLEQHHATAKGLWLRLAKKRSDLESVSYIDAVLVALCFGWIDGQARGLDEQSSLQRFTPRGPRSAWSQVNVGRVEQLVAEGRMRPSGLAAVEAAKADGRWERAYAPPSTAEVPADFQAALDAVPAAATFFAGLTGMRRYSFLYQVQEAKRPETRARRIAKFVDLLSRGETLR
jgi:uncharacterized protein YdeI (YjbR/CyaY-like superfamily)